MFKKLVFYVLGVVCLSFTLTACHQKSKDQPKNVLRINFQEGDLPSLHPHDLIIYLRGLSVAKVLYEGLTRVNEQGKVDLTGAESVTVSEDGLQYTFKLRKTYWSDGSSVTANQYERAWKQALSPTSDCSRADLLYVVKYAEEAKKGEVSLDEVGVYAVDDETLVVDLAYPNPCFLELLTQPVCFPLKNPECREISVFNGPFHVQEWRQNDCLKLVANPHFWDADSIDLEGIEIYMIEDAMTAFSLYERGELDWMGVPLTPLTGELIDRIQAKGGLESAPVDRAFWIFLNVDHPLLCSAKIRQALSLAADRGSIVQHIFKSGRPLKKALPYSVLPIAVNQGILEDLDVAKQLFEEGLAELELTRDSLPTLAITYSQQSNRKQVAEFLQQQWSRTFSIPVQVKSQEWTVLRSNLEKGLFHAAGCFEVSYYNDPVELLERFTSYNPANFSQWVNDAFKEKIASAKQQADLTKRHAFLAEAEEILIENTPFIPISADEFLFTHHPNLHGYVFDYVGAVDFSQASFR